MFGTLLLGSYPLKAQSHFPHFLLLTATLSELSEAVELSSFFITRITFVGDSRVVSAKLSSLLLNILLILRRLVSQQFVAFFSRREVDMLDWIRIDSQRLRRANETLRLVAQCRQLPEGEFLSAGLF